MNEQVSLGGGRRNDMKLVRRIAIATSSLLALVFAGGAHWKF